MTSAVLIIPVALLDKANDVGELMEWGPDNYTVPLSAGGPVTHYMCRTDVSQSFLDKLANPPPHPLIQQVLAALIVDLSETLWGYDHAVAALTANNLQFA